MLISVEVPGENGPLHADVGGLKVGDTFTIPGLEGSYRATEIAIDDREDEASVKVIAELLE